MATVGLNIDFRIGSNGTPTTEVDISVKTKKCDFPREQDMLDVTPFNGNGFRQFAVGLQQGKFSGEFYWDTTIDTHLSGLLGYVTPVEFIYGPDGTTAGRPTYTGTLFLVSLSNPATVGEVKLFTAEFQITGTIVRALYP